MERDRKMGRRWMMGVAVAILLGGCSSLSGIWSGEVDCGDIGGDVEIELEKDDDVWVGEGEWDCTDLWGYDCTQTFDTEIEKEDLDDGEWELDVNNSDCVVIVLGVPSQAGCTDPHDVYWDGRDTITGEWDVCDFELERD